jgi:hypothetical protein
MTTIAHPGSQRASERALTHQLNQPTRPDTCLDDRTLPKRSPLIIGLISEVVAGLILEVVICVGRGIVQGHNVALAQTETLPQTIMMLLEVR